MSIFTAYQSYHCSSLHHKWVFLTLHFLNLTDFFAWASINSLHCSLRVIAFMLPLRNCKVTDTRCFTKSLQLSLMRMYGDRNHGSRVRVWWGQMQMETAVDRDKCLPHAALYFKSHLTQGYTVNLPTTGNLYIKVKQDETKSYQVVNYNKKLSYRRETARQLRIHAQLTRCFSAVAV